MSAIVFWKYFGVCATIIASGFGAPIPEEIPIVTAGAMAGHDAAEALDAGALGGGPVFYLLHNDGSQIRWYYMLPACIVAVVVGDTILYAIGRFFGRRLLHSGFVTRRVLPADKRAKIEQNFHERGIMILLGARFTPGIRTPVFIMSGMLHMPLSRFVLADALYAVPGVTLLFWLAYVFTDQFKAAVESAERHKPMIAVAVLSAVGGVLLYRWATTRRLSTGNPEEIPAYAKPVAVGANVVEHAVEVAVEKTVEKTVGLVEKVAHPHGHAAPPKESPGTTVPGGIPQSHGSPGSATPGS